MLSAGRFSAIIFVQYSFLLFDICVNSFSNFAKKYPIDLLIIYITQDFCLITALAILLVNFFSTYIFQAGLIHILYGKFRGTLLLSIFYIIISIALHVWQMTIIWGQSDSHDWTNGFTSLNYLHKTVSVFYYYSYKRAALTLGDPRFHESTAWLQNSQSQSLP